MRFRHPPWDAFAPKTPVLTQASFGLQTLLRVRFDERVRLAPSFAPFDRRRATLAAGVSRDGERERSKRNQTKKERVKVMKKTCDQIIGGVLMFSKRSLAILAAAMLMLSALLCPLFPAVRADASADAAVEGFNANDLEKLLSFLD